MKNIFKTFYYLLIAGIVGIAFLIVIPMLPIPGNIQIKVVLSGSMEPAIPVGRVIVIKSAESYVVGDVVTYGKDTKTDIPTTHRIIDMRVEGDEIFFKTQGDANDDPDITELKEGAIAGKVLITIPFLGYLIDFAKKPMGFAMLVIIPVAIVIIDEIRKILAEIKKIHTHRHEKSEKKKAAKGEKSQDPFAVGKSDSEPAAKNYSETKPAVAEGYSETEPAITKGLGVTKKDPFAVGSDRSASAKGYSEAKKK